MSSEGKKDLETHSEYWARATSKNDYATELHRACAEGQPIEKIVELVEKMPKFRRVIDRNGMLPIHHALSRGKFADFHVVEYVLSIFEEGARRSVEHGRMPLHIAVKEGCSLPIIAMLLNLMPEATRCTTKVLEQTPLHYAVRYGASIDVVRMLIRDNPSVLEMSDAYGRLPLHVALRNRCPQNIIHACVRGNKMTLRFCDKNGMLPLHVAALAAVRLPALRLVVEESESLQGITRDGDTILHVACRSCFPPVLKYLLHIGMSTAVTNHKGKRPHQCIPSRPRRSRPDLQILGFDRNQILECLKIMTCARRPWNPNTHHLFPPNFRKSAYIVALATRRFEMEYCEDWIPTCGRHVVPRKQLSFPFVQILKFCDRAWFDTAAKTKMLRALQPHLNIGQLGKQAKIDLLVSRMNGVPGAHLDKFARRRAMHKVRMRVRNLARSMQVDVIRIASKRIAVTAQTLAIGGDKTNDVVARLDEERAQKDAIITRARKAAKQRRESAMLKKMASFMRAQTPEFVHPLDAMEANAERDIALQAVHKRISEKYSMTCDPELSIAEYQRGLELALQSDQEYAMLISRKPGKPWWEFLEPGFGVNELFYEQLLREDVRMEHNFMQEVNKLHAYDNEDKYVHDALADASYQMIVDSQESLNIIMEFQGYLESVHESQMEEEQNAFYNMAGGKEKVMEIVNSIDKAGSAEVVAAHESKTRSREEMRSKELEEEEWWLASELGILDEWDEEKDSGILAPCTEAVNVEMHVQSVVEEGMANDLVASDTGYAYLQEGYGEDRIIAEEKEGEVEKHASIEPSHDKICPKKHRRMSVQEEEDLHRYLEKKYG